MSTSAPYESIFLLPSPVCKSCGTPIPEGTNTCSKCGETFQWPLREKAAISAIMAYVAAETVKEEAARILADFKARKWCKTHGFQKVLPLEKDGRVFEVCTRCIARAMVEPLIKSGDPKRLKVKL